MRKLHHAAVSWFFCVMCAASACAADGWQAGVATANITPPQFMPMAGYASRGAKHAEEKLTDLWAKVLVLRLDERDERETALLVTLDVVGLDRDLGLDLRQSIAKELGLEPEQIVLNASHTHTGPVVAKNLRPMHYMLLDEADRKLVDDYARFLKQQVLKASQEAMQNLKPAEMSWGSGTATFAVNRRNNPAADVPKLREQNALKGPYDHDVPVLAVKQDGKLIAAAFGYACHNTTLDTFQWSGDYAGFAMERLEELHPGTIALYWAGCGADQNPLPRRTVELAKQYGTELAAAVEGTLKGEMNPVAPSLATEYAEIDLPFGTLPTREELVRDSESSNQYIAARARSLLKTVDSGEPLPTTYPYPVAVWNLGGELRWVFLGGEVVVDFALRLKGAGGEPEQTWVAGYSNDVMAYIPSRRVLLEGGYEGGGAMVYYGLPTVWAPEVEEAIVREVERQMREVAIPR
jgi:hypothetical protein